MAGSFQSVIPPLKTLASTSELTVKESTPSRWYASATGPNTIGRCQAGFSLQRLAAGSIWSRLSGESDPAKSTWLAMNCSRPAPEPVGLYARSLPGHSSAHSSLKSAMAFC